MKFNLQSFNIQESWIQAALDIINSVPADGAIGLAGGSTPKPIYERVAQKDGQIFFVTDERYVSSEDEQNNTHLVYQTMGRDVSILAPDTSLPLTECVEQYAKDLEKQFSTSSPDLFVLGMGTDGHVASLFPPVTKPMFGPQLAIHTTTEHFAVFDRISVTLPLLLSAKKVVLLMKGEDKQQAWTQMLTSQDFTMYPMLHVLEEVETEVLLLEE
jgi:6-phosphogluconolactonase/glucosamine-6-phosphate isomerase/deaminase